MQEEIKVNEPEDSMVVDYSDPVSTEEIHDEKMDVETIEEQKETTGNRMEVERKIVS